MADNVAVTAGSGVSIAADDIGGVHHQRVKLSIGVDGTAADVRAPVDALPQGVSSPAGAMTFHTASSQWYMARNAGADGQADYSLSGAGNMLYNGATFDRQRGNIEGTLLASAARTATTTSAIQTNYNHRGVAVYFFATVVGTGTIQVSITGYANSLGFTAATGSAVSSSAAVLLMYPGVVDADTSVDARAVVLPRSWDATITKSDASSWTYQVTYALIL
jgi:hypothetical protein